MNYWLSFFSFHCALEKEKTPNITFSTTLKRIKESYKIFSRITFPINYSRLKYSYTYQKHAHCIIYISFITGFVAYLLFSSSSLAKTSYYERLHNLCREFLRRYFTYTTQIFHLYKTLMCWKFLLQFVFEHLTQSCLFSSLFKRGEICIMRESAFFNLENTK